ncbi:MAG TPA: heme lyase CcmF/NrfE family subunit [Bryobacteraceae bacterium]|jgi:cytochrome c-type biogenesis protein CcmF|nr:heme lyase CcmF/NrfE family subunit [Bryobacteraceae bacterium]
MENIGALSILLAFCFAIYAVIGSVAGKVKKNAFLVVSAERAVYSVWILLTIASGLLIYSLIVGDFRLGYVAAHTDQSMPNIYKFTAWWGGQEGSLLLWAWILATYSAVVVFMNRRKFRDMMPWVTAVLMATETFFLILISFVLSPFAVLIAGRGNIVEGMGRGLNPLLQYWTMVIHPPMLYLGYVGFTVPFAFAMGSLITKQPGESWIHTTRRWTIVTWLFQSTGILLGQGWAYAVLGWGGYWAWDPVENASLLPWITATAFLHSVMMQEKKGMMKVWNMVLISGTFFLCIFGTFLTRSGVVSSVHAFAQSSIGTYFVTFLALGLAATIYLILDRLPYLKSEARLESVVSRESSFMFNNLILLASCFAVLWGTLFPVISEAVTGEKISVDAPFFNRINVPIAFGLMLLTGVGPLIAWRRSSMESLRRAFFWPSIAGVALMAVLAFFGAYEHPYALVSFGLCMFVTTTIFSEFWKGAAAIRAKSGTGLLAAAVELTHRNTRRYGGYMVHMGIVFMFIGYTGAAFNKDVTKEIAPGQSFEIGRYTIKAAEVLQSENSNYASQKLIAEVSAGGKSLGTLEPEHRFYKSSQQPTSEVAIRRRLNEDLYINFAGPSTDGTRAVVQAYVFPLVSWIWIGFWVLAMGTIVCLIPSKVRLSYARTQVLGVTQKHATVEK